MSSSNAPFATAASATDSDAQKGGRRRYEHQSQKSDAPFATEYPEAREEEESSTPRKRVGRKRFDDQDAQHDAPFATASGEPMFESPPPKEAQDAVDGRQKAVKPQDNSAVFRYDGTPDDTPSKAGRRRYDAHSQRSEAPFAMDNGEDLRSGSNSVETPRSAGGRRRFEDKLQQQPAPFALDDGNNRFRNACQARADDAPGAFSNGSAGLKKPNRNAPPPNNAGAGRAHGSSLQNCPFALN